MDDNRLSCLLASPQNIIKSLINSFPDDISLSDLYDNSSNSRSRSGSDHNDDELGNRSVRLVHEVISLLNSKGRVVVDDDDDDGVSLTRNHHHIGDGNSNSTPTLSLPNSFEDDALNFKDIQRKYYINRKQQQQQQQHRHLSRCTK